MRLVLGSRGSLLALTQAKWAARKLAELNPALEIDIEVIKTTGDKILDSPLSKIGDKGLFVKEIETALENGEIDFAVHSVKDLPSVLPESLTLAAIPEREDPADVLITNENLTWEKLPQRANIGTSALRRQSQILFQRPDLSVTLLRGNVDTRIRKLDEGLYFGIILARAGLNRLGINRGRSIPRSILLPAPGQGALAIEARKKDKDILEILHELNHPETDTCVSAERSFLAVMEGGCQVPLGAFAEIRGQRLVVEGFVGSPDGKIAIREKVDGDLEAPGKAGEALANSILARGGGDIIRNLVQKPEPDRKGSGKSR